MSDGMQDDLIDQQPHEERVRQQKAARHVKLPRESALKVEKGAAAYLGVATAINVAGEDVIILAKNSLALMTVHQRITNFADFKLGLVHKAVIMAASSVELDDEL